MQIPRLHIQFDLGHFELGHGEYEPDEGKAVKLSMNVFGLVLGIGAFLIFLAMALFDAICAGPHERGNDLVPRAHRKKLRHSRA